MMENVIQLYYSAASSLLWILLMLWLIRKFKRSKYYNVIADGIIASLKEKGDKWSITRIVYALYFFVLVFLLWFLFTLYPLLTWKMPEITVEHVSLIGAISTVAGVTKFMNKKYEGLKE